MSAASLPGNAGESAPGKFSAALGALELADAPLHAMLLDASLEHALHGRRRRRRWTSYAVMAVALMAVVAAGNARRDATLRITQRAVDSLTTLAAPGLAAQEQLQQITREQQLLSTRTRPASDPLHVLAILSDALPSDAFVQRLEWSGGVWRLDGSVNQAASVVPRLDSVSTFTGVRVLAASTRFRDGARMRESFSVAFQVKGDSVARR